MRSSVSRSTSVAGSRRFGPDLLGIEDVETAPLRCRGSAAARCVRTICSGRLVEIGNEHDDAAAPQKLLEMVERLGEIGARARLGLFEAAQQPDELALPRGGPDVVAHLIVEDDQAGGVALVLDGEIKQRSGREARVIHLVDGVGRVLHGVAGVEQHGQQAVGFAAIALQVGALGAGEDVPVHVAQVVARRVGAVFGELLAEAEIGRAVQARRRIRRPPSSPPGPDRKCRRAPTDRGKRCTSSGLLTGGGICSSSRRRISSELDAVGFRVEVQQDAVAQHRDRQRRDVLVSDVIAAGEPARGPSPPAR